MAPWYGLTSRDMTSTPHDVDKCPFALSRPLPDHGFNLIIKNTFLDLELAPDTTASLRARSCSARFARNECVEACHKADGFSGDGQETASSAGTGMEDGDTWADDESALSDELACVYPSLGSRLHNSVAADCMPLCQPCAWFHKAAGCKNGQQCGFCHLCPKEEMKSRKKQKHARFRAQDDGQHVLLPDVNV